MKMNTSTAGAADWRDLAACRDLDPELFFDPRRAAKAARACAGCPVRDACLDWALRYPEDHGVWGGMGEQERRAAGTSRRPRSSALCLSGRHLKDGPGRCPGCVTEYQRKRETGPDRDYAAVYAGRVARKKRELAA